MREMNISLAGEPVSKGKLLEALALANAPGVRHCEHHFDTPSGELAGAGLSLAMCQTGGRWTQRLLACGEHANTRVADRVEVTTSRRSESPAVDAGRHRTQAARLALDKALAGRTSEPEPSWIEHFRLRFTRRTRTMDAEGGQLEISLDEGAIDIDGRRLPVCEVTMSLQSGQGLAQMFDLAHRLVRDHRFVLNSLAPSWRGMAEVFPSSPVNVACASRVAFDPCTDDDQLLRTMVAHCMRQILPNASWLAAGSCQPEQVHQLRVGLRRLRTVLRELGVLADDADPAWDQPLTKAFRALGLQRDRELMLHKLAPQWQAAGAPAVAYWPMLDPAPGSLRRAVRDPSFQSTLLDLLAFSWQPASSPSRRQGRGGCKLLEGRLQKLHSQVVADGKRFADLTEAQQHRVRKRLKRLRYLSEFARPLFKGSEVDRYLERLSPAQDALGEHNDHAVALNSWRRQQPREAGEWFAVGWLTARQRSSTQACLDALQKINRAKRFWICGHERKAHS
jgi:triphosphatase